MQSKQNTDHTAGIFVDHAREGSRELLARILGHTLDFGVQAFRDQIVERFAENVALPELFRVALILAKQVFDQFVRLLLVAYNRAQLGLDVGAHEMNRRRACF